MRKFLLYFLLLLLLVAVGAFSYGFWNAKKIRSFAAELETVRDNHNFSSQIEEIERSFQEDGKKDAAQIRDSSIRLKERLFEVERESDTARREAEAIPAPKIAKPAKDLAIEYFSKTNRQARDLEGIIDYTGQITETAAILGEMKEDVTLDEIKGLIARAEERGNTINADVLPENLRVTARDLKDSMNVFLARMQETAESKSENSSALDESYGDFSQKEDEFFTAARSFMAEMENLGIIEQRLKVDIEKLGKMKFSLK